MIGLLQRVISASVSVDGEIISEIDTGLMVLVGMQRGDTLKEAERLLQRLLAYRVFEDEAGKMNRSLTDIQGGLLLVPQFTLPADTRKGNRPSFTPSLAPDQAEPLFQKLLGLAESRHATVTSGRFGADMQVSLTNDGPVTFWLEVPPG